MIKENYKELKVQVKRPFIKTVSNLSYAQVAELGAINRDLKMNLLIPQMDEPMPVVVFVPGGRFLYVSNDSNIQNRLRLAERGFVVASIEYRLAPNNNFPAPIIDLKSAIRYLRANAETYHINPEKVAVYGESAGGYMATFAGTTNGLDLFNEGRYLEYSSDVNAVVDLFGVTNLETIGADFSEAQQKYHKEPPSPESLFLYGADAQVNQGLESNPDKLKTSNPMSYITDKTPPFLIMHGGEDKIMSITESKQLHEALCHNGIDSKFYFIKNAEHSGVVWEQDEIINILIDFLKHNLT